MSFPRGSQINTRHVLPSPWRFLPPFPLINTDSHFQARHNRCVTLLLLPASPPNSSLFLCSSLFLHLWYIFYCYHLISFSSFFCTRTTDQFYNFFGLLGYDSIWMRGRRVIFPLDCSSRCGLCLIFQCWIWFVVVCGVSESWSVKSLRSWFVNYLMIFFFFEGTVTYHYDA